MYKFYIKEFSFKYVVLNEQCHPIVKFVAVAWQADCSDSRLDLERALSLSTSLRKMTRGDQ